MSKVYVTKTYPYDPTFGGKLSRYDGYLRITQGKLDPDVSKDLKAKPPNKVGRIYCSTHLRGRSTANCLVEDMQANIESTKLINEIEFDLGKLVKRNEFEKHGSSIVRKRFIEGFIEDKLLEKRGAINKRIDSFLKKLRNNDEEILFVVSHSFFMKVMEFYLKQPGLFEHPERLSNHFDYRKNTYNFGEGFEFSL